MNHEFIFVITFQNIRVDCYRHASLNSNTVQVLYLNMHSPITKTRLLQRPKPGNVYAVKLCLLGIVI